MQSIPDRERRFEQDRGHSSYHPHGNPACRAGCCPQGHPLARDLLACCMDKAVCHPPNPRTGLQRTLTLIEGEPACDFRTHTITGPAGTKSGA